MGSDRLRRQIAWEAARLLCHREESEFFRARWKAALRVHGRDVRPGDLPSHREIRDEMRKMTDALERDAGDPQMAIADATESGDRFRLYEMLLAPLEQVQQNPRRHPEGDALYHSLQVFEIAREELPYDEEFLLAALLHDVGKAIDPKDHVAAGLAALDGSITARTAWLIEHHPEAQALAEGKIGVRCHRRLAAAEDYDELLLLAACDRQGRVRGMRVPDVRDALAYLRELAASNEP
jgi:predicted HD phosphohydrolase